jgi:hypothetical protein
VRESIKMKLGIYAIVLLVLATAAMASSDFKTECTNKGFDFGIAKYEKSGSSWNEVERNSLYPGYEFSVSGSLKDADWTADPAVAGVLVKAGTQTVATAGGTSGSVTCLIKPGTSNCQDISHITFCGNYEDLNCVDAIKAGLLTGSINGGTAKVTNNGQAPYTVGLAVYKIFKDEDHTELDGQVLFDSDAGTVGPGAVLDQSINMPGCQYQIDLYCGSVITQFDKDGGVIYGDRKLDYEHDYDSDLCVNEYCGDGTVNGDEDCENNAQCDDSNPFTEDICNACDCEHHQTCVGCECDNSCDPCITNPESCTGVPEFSPITMLVAVAIAGLGLAYFRKN